MRIWGIKSGLARYQCRFALASLMTASTRALEEALTLIGIIGRKRKATVRIERGEGGF